MSTVLWRVGISSDYGLYDYFKELFNIQLKFLLYKSLSLKKYNITCIFKKQTFYIFISTESSYNIKFYYV